MFRALITIADFALGAALTKRNVADYSVLYMDEAPLAGYTFYQSGTYCSDGFIFDGKDPDCTQKCSVEPSCNYYTEYSNGYCQMSSSCTNPQKALDASANTFLKATSLKAVDPDYIYVGASYCRGPGGDADVPSFTEVSGVVSDSECRAKCDEANTCSGYHWGYKCQIYTSSIGAAKSTQVKGHCWRKAKPTQSPTQALPSTAAVGGLVPEQEHDVKFEELPKDFCKKTPTYWIHIPKCGYSFLASVRECKTVPGEKAIVDFSLPHKPLTSAIPLKYVVSFFRKPNQRLASGFAYGRHNAQGMRMWQPYENNTAGIVAKIYAMLHDGRNAANDDYLGKNFLGCQTNMILGRGCMQGTPTDPSKDAKEAISKVEKFRFVGLVEEWPLSICLFNYLTTGTRFVTYSQLTDTHATHRVAGKAEKQSATIYDTRGYTRDVADEQLYAYVVERFHADLSKHDITIEKCSYTPEGRPFVLEE